jgi:hypothetical protein
MMSFITAVLIYLAISATMTMMGVIYWMAVENMQSTGERREFSHLYLIGIISLFFTPIGAWLVSAFVRLRSLSGSMR